MNATANKPAWTAGLGAADKTTFAEKPQAQPGTFFHLVEGQRAGASVVVRGKIRRGDISREMLVPLPAVTNERIQQAIMGANAPGIVALVEWALDELERQGKTLTVENRP